MKIKKKLLKARLQENSKFEAKANIKVPKNQNTIPNQTEFAYSSNISK